MDEPVLEYNVCSLCRSCGGWSITVRRGDSGYRVLGTSRITRTVRKLEPRDPKYLEAYKAVMSDPRAAEYRDGLAAPVV
jgi:hypothetical protein